MNNGINLQNCTIQTVIQQNSDSQVNWDVLRLDLIHPLISGNKYFKLKYYLSDAIKSGQKGLVSFGGAWSNHIAAVAVTAKLNGLSSIGLIRGEEPAVFSPTLENAREAGMDLKFISREEYPLMNRDPTKIAGLFPGYQVIPEGGYGEAGMKGAAEILQFEGVQQYDYIFVACGTGTTLAGLAYAAEEHQVITGIPVLKNPAWEEKAIDDLLARVKKHAGFTLINRYHFGGYARFNAELLHFMNDFYNSYGIPTDFVYTGKLMFAVNDLIINNYFPAGSRILAIHSGGLQGNRSLKPGKLSF